MYKDKEKELECKKLYYLKNKAHILENNKKRYKENKDAVLLRMKSYYQENKAKIKSRTKAYRAKNHDRVLQAEQRYNDTNRVARRKYHNKYSKENRVKRNIIAANRRARIKENGGVISLADIVVLEQKQGNRCLYCNNEFDGNRHMEHKIPLKRGGRNDIDNVVFACKPCNLSKGIKTPEEFIGVAL